MGPHMRRTLVIDACVIGAAGTTEHPTSRHCREFLSTVLKVGHRAALCEKLREEWKKHSSKYGMRWRTAMAKRTRTETKVVYFDSDQLSPIEISLSSVLGSDWKALHDTHLIVLALAADEIVVSLDEIAQKGFAGVASRVPKIGRVCWVNPSKEDENAVKWAKAGAKNEDWRKLSFIEMNLNSKKAIGKNS